MNLRNILLLTALAVFLSACAITPRSHYRDYDQRYDDGYYYDYRNTPSYEGYYYVRIIFIRNVPYYVDDDRYIRPIPPHLHDHFRRYPYDTLGRPPVFSRDTEVRDGYHVSRIIYFDGVPYHVENDHIAQPLPEQLHQRFKYTPANRGSDQDRNQDEPVLNRRDRERIEQPPFARGQREGGKDDSADTTKSVPDQRKMPMRPDQPNAGGSHADTPSIKGRDRNGNRPQATDDSGNKKTERKKSRTGKKDKKGDRPQADDGGGKNPRKDNRRD